MLLITLPRRLKSDNLYSIDGKDTALSKVRPPHILLVTSSLPATPRHTLPEDFDMDIALSSVLPAYHIVDAMRLNFHLSP